MTVSSLELFLTASLFLPIKCLFSFPLGSAITAVAMAYNVVRLRVTALNSIEPLENGFYVHFYFSSPGHGTCGLPYS